MGVIKVTTCVFIIAIVMASGLFGANIDTDRVSVCRDPELLRAIEVMSGVCNDFTCDGSSLRQLGTSASKVRLLSALAEPTLMPINLFFPAGRSDLRDIFDWNSAKRDQMCQFNGIADPENTFVFVIGRTSNTGSVDSNNRLRRERMANVLRYLRDELHVRCRRFRGVWVPKGVFTLAENDARLLKVDAREYRYNVSVLNQSVQVFVYPCANAAGK
jgi:hypothetical protein